MTTTAKTVTERWDPDIAAATGAAWLDVVYAEWPHHIDRGTLRMDYCTDCIAGQTFEPAFYVPTPGGPLVAEGGYDVLFEMAFAVLRGGGLPGSGSAVEWMAEHGFTLPGPSSVQRQEKWERLRLAWLDEIDARLGASR